MHCLNIPQQKVSETIWKNYGASTCFFQKNIYVYKQCYWKWLLGVLSPLVIKSVSCSYKLRCIVQFSKTDKRVFSATIKCLFVTGLTLKEIHKHSLRVYANSLPSNWTVAKSVVYFKC